MGGYGIGQGLAQGVRTAIQAGLSLAELKQRKEQFDTMQGYRDRYLAAMTGFNAGYAGDESEGNGQPDASASGPSLSFPPPAQEKEAQVGRLTVPGMTPFRAPRVAPASPAQSITPSKMGVPSRGMMLGFGRRRF